MFEIGTMVQISKSYNAHWHQGIGYIKDRDPMGWYVVGDTEGNFLDVPEAELTVIREPRKQPSVMALEAKIELLTNDLQLCKDKYQKLREETAGVYVENILYRKALLKLRTVLEDIKDDIQRGNPVNWMLQTVNEALEEIDNA